MHCDTALHLQLLPQQRVFKVFLVRARHPEMYQDFWGWMHGLVA